MDKPAAARLIKETFQGAYDRSRFVHFVKNLLNHMEESEQFIYRGNYIPDAYKPYVHSLERIGKYIDAEGNKIDVLTCRLKKETSLERARTRQRNFIAWYLNGSRGGVYKDASLVAFHADHAVDWRFSLIKMDYRIGETKTGRPRATVDLTPARRYSFLVGENENSHTAQARFVWFLEDDVRDPKLPALEDAFSIEKVTKEFFEKYRDLFNDLKDAFDRICEESETVRKDFAEKGVDNVNLAKKTLGQIVFLYFLQKKGWFGVARDANWGTGPKNFLRQLFIKGNYKNFFNDIMEPLFYEALAKERDQDYYSRFDCKIPFLNGGLFDPLNDYDWVHADILLPNDLFSNMDRTKEGDTGTGILDIFDRYNFTVKEDEPLEREVAVDPEMLGKVFENLLEVKDRKSKGTYYTPREIVHYMCRESLIRHLESELVKSGKDLFVVDRKDIETFIRFGELTSENDLRVSKEGRETDTYSYKMPESIRKNAALIDSKLVDIKICDPAVGSGAFLVGMMTEVVKARQVLTTYMGASRKRNPYNFKRHAIQNSLYGVDIDPGAVEIAKLRLWLSLIVDEEDIKEIRPLPNLDYKIMQGDSLLEEFEGIRLFDESLISPAPSNLNEQIEIAKKEQTRLQRELFRLDSLEKRKSPEKKMVEMTLEKQAALLKRLFRYEAGSSNSELFDSEVKRKADELKELHRAFFEASQKSKKDQVKKLIESMEWELIEATLEEQKKSSALKKLSQYRKANVRPFFLWKFHYAEVFQEKSGFDIVIANPPYVRHETIKALKPSLASAFGDFYSGTADIYTYFYKCGIDLLKSGGHLCFISPNKFMRAGYGRNLRKFLTTQATPRVVIDFGDLPIFDATTYPAILLIENSRSGGVMEAATFTNPSQLEKPEEILADIGFPLPVLSLNEEGWNLERPEVLALMEKLKASGKPLGEYVQGRFYYGIKTGFNEAFVIDEATRKKLISEDPSSADLIKPWLRGRDIRKWKARWAGLYVINIPSSANHKWPWSDAKKESEALRLFEQTYRAVYGHLSQWKKQLKKRDDQGKFWWELRSCVYYKDFEQVKIIYPDIAQGPKFTWDESPALLGNTAYIIPTDETWLVGLLNSKLIWWYYQNISSIIRGGFVRFIAQYMETIPITPTTDTQKAPIIERTLAILADPDSPNVPRLEAEIDELIYSLYNLTPEEIQIVEGIRDNHLSK